MSSSEDKMMNDHVDEEDLALMKQLSLNINNSKEQLKLASLLLDKAHADKRAAESELRATQAEYNGQMMKLLWKYKLESSDSVRQSDGLIIKGDSNEKDDSSSEG